ncbi:MAG: bifunctional diaminohydroxyphosphoribosylaminopyrimidine deaminase/5-amino-6-(5-phosphoribosylamino)uracil reductase RibD [Acidimicrobiia bacterium]
MDARWMAEAIGEAAETRPHPNPRVGALVIDRNGDLLAVSSHVGVGEPHAEVAALRHAGPRAAGGTLYTTLEPCVHFGRTPPCVAAIIDSGVGRVVIGSVDPDPRVDGRGVAALEEAGIEVTVGVLSEQVEASDRAYFHHRRFGRPLVTLKAALTLDGQLAASDGSSQWITLRETRRDAHRLRSEADGVVIGAGTLRADNPRLTVRLESYSDPQPTPVVVLGRQPVPPDAALLHRHDLLVVSPIEQPEIEARTLVVPDEMGGRVDLQKAVELLGEEGLLDLLVEGGSAIFKSLLDAGLADRLIVYLGGKVAGGRGLPLFDGTFETLSDATAWRISDATLLGTDLRLTAYPAP